VTLENLQKVHSALCKSSPHCNITNDEWKGDAWITQRQEAIKIVHDALKECEELKGEKLH
jgi:hypothetical protein